jgi:hypothetical protein
MEPFRFGLAIFRLHRFFVRYRRHHSIRHLLGMGLDHSQKWAAISSNKEGAPLGGTFFLPII